MKIWLINHYAVPPQYYPLARQTNFAKYLQRMGHEAVVFAASTVHNSNQNLITDGSAWREDYVEGVHYVYVKCRPYKGNGLSRILNMYEFAMKLPGVCDRFERPDAIIATSMPPMSCAAGLKIARKFRCVGIAEIADLWPASIVAYGLAKANSVAVKYLRTLEKWIYKTADAIVFTMEGGYDYIVDQHWESEISRNKVFFINNGVDLSQYDVNKETFIFSDDDLNNENTYKIVYTGSLRQANAQIFALLDAAELIQRKGYRDYKFLIYGKGDYKEEIKKICEKKKLNNVLVKGFVDKKYIPFVLSKCDLNVLNCIDQDILKYGGSQNKLFDYLASGHPIISGENNRYSIVRNRHCGISKSFGSTAELVDAIISLHDNPPDSKHIREVAQEYDFKELTKQLLNVIDYCIEKRR